MFIYIRLYIILYKTNEFYIFETFAFMRHAIKYSFI